MSYILSETTPVHLVETQEFENGIWIPKTEFVKGLFPFGFGCKMITDENLTDSMAEYLLTKDEFKEFIISESKTELKTNKKTKK